MSKTEISLTTPPLQSGMCRDALHVLDGVEGLLIYKEFESKQAVFGRFENRSKYKVSVLPTTRRNVFVSEEEFKTAPSLFEGREETSSCCPKSSQPHPPSQVGLFPPTTVALPGWPHTVPLLTVSQPPDQCYFSQNLRRQRKLVVAVGENEVIGEAISEPVSCEDCLFCVTRVRTIDIERRHMHSFSSSCLGVNCCAPSCCNPIFSISILSPEDQSRTVGMLKRLFPGFDRCCCSADADNYLIEFPPNATRKEKELILGALFWYDRHVFHRPPTEASD